MYKLFVLAVVVATAQAGIIAAPGLINAGLPYAGLAGHGYNHGLAGYGYNHGLINAGLPYAAGIHAGVIAAPAVIAKAAPVAVAPAVVAAPIATKYALPAPRVVEHAPIVEKVVEPVEQHGYSIRY